MKKYILALLCAFFTVCSVGFVSRMNEKDVAPNREVMENTVVEIQNIQCALETPYGNIEEIADSSETIIWGSIKNRESFATLNGIIWTKETVNVLEILKGSYVDNEIYVYKMGGEVTVDEYVNSYSSDIADIKRAEYSQYNKDSMVKQLFSEKELSDIGTCEILFLRQISKFDQEDNAYEPFGDYMGIYTSDLSCELENNATSSNANPRSSAIGELYETSYNGYFGSFTYDALQSLIK